MDSSLENRLMTIAKKLRDIAQELENVAITTQVSKEKKITRVNTRGITIDEDLMEKLRGLGRDEAIGYLQTLGHRQLASIVRSLGGSSEEAKRTKEIIIERILYRLFDYSAGHKIIKGEAER